MMRYVYNSSLKSWFLKVSETRAKKIFNIGKSVYLFDVTGAYVSTAFPNYPVRDWIRGGSKILTLGEWKNHAHITIYLRRNKDCKLSYYIPVAWYDRFSGEEVEAFDSVRGIEEYNHRFECF